MTKTLTEQWLEGKLESGWYYIKIYWGAGYDIIFDNYNPTTGLFVDFGKEVKEVLAPVPDYDEYKQLVSKTDESSRKALQLEKKLEIATKALQYYADGTLGSSVARQALKEMEGVK